MAEEEKQEGEEGQKEQEEQKAGANQEGSEESDELDEEQESSKGRSKKKLIISIIVIILVVIAIALGAYYMTSAGGDKKDKSKQDSEKEETHSPEKAKSSKAKSPNKDSQFFDLEEFVVNLNPDSGKQEYLKLIITIQVNKNVNIKKIENKLPVIRDNLTTFLTTLKTEDIKGSSGVAMLKEELLKRLNLLLDPLEIENVLIKELLIT